MKITSVTPFTVRYPEPNDNNNIRYLTFCKVEAEDGTVGWGEAITQFAESTKATALVIEGMARNVIGRDCFDNVAIWRSIKGATWWYGWHGGIASFALSAIDIALWDLKGKLLGIPLIELLGGAFRERLPVIASTHIWRPSLEEEAERHGRYVNEEGYLGVKIGMGKFGEAHVGYEFDRDVRFVELLRSAIGPDAMLMMDRGQSLRWTVADAIRRTNAFEQYGLTWIEEPLEPTEIDSFRQLRSHVKCLVATGEREWDAYGYRRFLDTGVADVVGCDVGRVEGITGALKVIELVEERDLWFNSHAWSSAVNTAASIALSGFTSRCLLQELKPDRNPMQHDLVEEPFKQVGGYIQMPTRPGLGVEVHEAVLEVLLLRRSLSWRSAQYSRRVASSLRCDKYARRSWRTASLARSQAEVRDERGISVDQWVEGTEEPVNRPIRSKNAAVNAEYFEARHHPWTKALDAPACVAHSET